MVASVTAEHLGRVCHPCHGQEGLLKEGTTHMEQQVLARAA